MNHPTELKYSKSHEWVKFLDETTALIGLTDYAQSELGDLVFVNLPEAGDEVPGGEAFADVESVKAVSDVFSPVSGTVAEVNEELLDAPEMLNQDPYGAWMIKVENITGTEELLDVIIRTMNGERIFPGSSPSVEMKNMLSGDISPIQIEILRHYIRGFTYREIADKFGLSVSGVRWNISDMIEKGGFNNKEELIATAIENKLVVTTLQDTK